MIAYNEQWLNNLYVQDEANRAFESDCIGKEEKERILLAYPAGFYSPNFFVRIGLFILTCIIVQFSLGLVSMVLFSTFSNEGLGAWFIVYGLLVYAGLEFMVGKKHYKSGADDALMWMAGGAVIGGINAAADVSWLTNALIVLILSLYLFLRFTNAIMAAIAFMAFIAVVFLCFIRLGPTAKATTPFLIMIVAGLLYLGIKRLLERKSVALYTTGLTVMCIAALVCFYVAGNYYVVREASIAMFKLDLQENESIPLGWLFWILTAIIPVIYIVRGIQKKDPVLLRVGLLLVAGVVFTVRYYYHVLPAETAMVIGGIFFITLSYFVTRYLHEAKYGFTHKEGQEVFFMDKLQVESLVIAQTFSSPQTPADAGPQFGGGSGGGGGATGEF
jgi:hypothetical protein